MIVPVKVWEELNSYYRKHQRKLEILTGIKDSLKEVEEAKRTGEKLPTLDDFLKGM